MKQSFLDKHGARIGLIIYTMSSIFMVSVMAYSFMAVLPDWVDDRIAQQIEVIK